MVCEFEDQMPFCCKKKWVGQSVTRSTSCHRQNSFRCYSNVTKLPHPEVIHLTGPELMFYLTPEFQNSLDFHGLSSAVQGLGLDLVPEAGGRRTGGQDGEPSQVKETRVTSTALPCPALPCPAPHRQGKGKEGGGEEGGGKEGGESREPDFITLGPCGPDAGRAHRGGAVL